jgi:hypothetical protein
MGLLTKLQQSGSNLTQYDGNTPSINPLATNASQMHNSYSVTGDNFNTVNSSYQQYLDGTGNILPSPSQLDLNGVTPTITPRGQALPYNNNKPN